MHHAQPSSLVCLLDCDNTLLDNDALKVDLTKRLLTVFSPAQSEAFWQRYEQTRSERGTIDYGATIERLRPEIGNDLADRAWSVIWDYPFAERLYPTSLQVLAHLHTLGAVVAILSDGDPLYQPHKIEASGLAAAVDGHVKVYKHKQDHLEEVIAWLPAERYLSIDDKATVLADIKHHGGRAFGTLQVWQGHYASIPASPPPDRSIPRISDLLQFSLTDLMHIGQ